jgi:hypothetical protein
MYWDSYLCKSHTRFEQDSDVARSDVDDVKEKLTVLQPMKGNITNILIMGTFKWLDT